MAEPVTTTPTIATLRRASPAEWDRIVDQCDQATYFHTRGWANVWERHSHGKLRPAAWLAEFSDGTTALLPSSEKTILDLPALGRYVGPLRTTISCCGNTYGGWVSASPLTGRHHRLLWEQVAGTNIQINENPFDDAVRDADLPWTETDFTQVVDLRQPQEQLMRSWAHGHRKGVRRARRAGLEATCAASLDDWREFYEVYTGSFDRWGDPVGMADARMFEIFRTQDPERIKLWVAKGEGRILAGAIRFYHRHSIMGWISAFRPEYRELKAVPFLHSEIIRDAYERGGYWWYDLLSSGGIGGVVGFKSQFGAQKWSANAVISRAPFKKRLATIKASLVGSGP
jgi:hypothetical protein